MSEFRECIIDNPVALEAVRKIQPEVCNTNSEEFPQGGVVGFAWFSLDVFLCFGQS
jgi:hypothetical protein